MSCSRCGGSSGRVPRSGPAPTIVSRNGVGRAITPAPRTGSGIPNNIILASSPAALQSLVDALEDLLVDETERANFAAQHALFDVEDRPKACVSVGRCEMLRELIQKMKVQMRQTT